MKKIEINGKSFELTEAEEKLFEVVSGVLAEKTKDIITLEKAKTMIEEAVKANQIDLSSAPAITELKEILRVQGEKLTAMTDTGTGACKSFGQQVANYVKANKDQFSQIVKSEGKTGFNLKVAASILNSTHVTGTLPQAFREPGITDYMAERRFIMDVIGTTPTSSPTYEWVEKKNPDGTVAFVLDTEAFANIDFDLDVNSMTAKDVGAYITVHENMLDDIDGLAGEIDRELIYQIKKAADAEILSGTGLTSHLKGLTTYASAGFSLTSIDIASPTIWDAISAAMRQVELVGFDTADCIFMNPADYENALGAKDSQGRYVGHPSLSPDGTRFAGVPISTTSFITAGKLLVGNKMTSNIKVLQDVEMAIGYNLTGEFVKRHITIRGGMRLIHFVKDNHVNSWVYDDITDIIAAITKEVA